MNRNVLQSRQSRLIEKIARSRNADGSYIISGPAGVGREEFAEEFVSLLLPAKKNEASAKRSGENIFKKVAETVRKNGKTRENEISIAQVRDVLYFMNLKSSPSSHMVCLIGGAEKMSLEAQNALLKSLEEPKDGNVFLLVTEAEGKLLDTIRSRSILLKVGLMLPATILECLKTEGVAEKDAQKAAFYGWGRIKRSREIASSREILQKLEKEEQDLEKLIKAPLFEKMLFFEKEGSDKKKALEKIDNWIGLLVAGLEFQSNSASLAGQPGQSFAPIPTGSTFLMQMPQRKFLEAIEQLMELRRRIKYSNASVRLAEEAAFLNLNV